MDHERILFSTIYFNTQLNRKKKKQKKFLLQLGGACIFKHTNQIITLMRSFIECLIYLEEIWKFNRIWIIATALQLCSICIDNNIIEIILLLYNNNIII